MAEKLKMQGLVNRIVRVLLWVPGLSRVIGRQLITLYVVGRKTGRRYVLPLAYTHQDDELLIGTPFAWARNLRTGDVIQVRYLGRPRSADVRVATDEPTVTAAYDVIARHNKNFAGFNEIGFDESGNPRPEDLHRAWAEGARVLYLTIH
ncbi:hypothetical protein [Actinoplanes utahensis]|uniref:Uncharacterized protein n=1 Tax=Actinoplanes utahensis TaxID=1869 RepID=A0A0A6UKZ3_ACTUT|nr:hypothetical protein [Actinoplanes utahensis]KHD75748.1 hypothetical protein MB27_21275 [Actinoplanes utahensis]GIF34497.1 hypothetical protein Aut01nite_74830 [Actinoplanes utahensis]